MDNKTIVVALGGVVFAIGAAMVLVVFANSVTYLDSNFLTAIADLVGTLVGRVHDNYVPGILMMVIGGLVMYFGSRAG